MCKALWADAYLLERARGELEEVRRFLEPFGRGPVLHLGYLAANSCNVEEDARFLVVDAVLSCCMAHVAAISVGECEGTCQGKHVPIFLRLRPSNHTKLILIYTMKA